MRRTTKKLDWKNPNVVGTIHEEGGWGAVARAGVDAVEVRVDSLDRPPDLGKIERLPLPAIITVRDHAEGGSRPLPADVRAGLYHELLPSAAAIDIEAANLVAMADVLKAAKERGVPVIASIHDFEGMPPARSLVAASARARARGAHVVKIAVRVSTAEGLARLFGLFKEIEPPLAVMGMGPLGRASRLACAACGSCLNYGWLGRPQVEGQWPAREFATLLRKALV